MRAVVQRVSSARVEVGAETVGEIGLGLCVLLGVTHSDTAAQAAKMANKLHGVRIFDDVDGVMNLSLADVDAAVLVVSQFTLYGDVSKGRRPTWIAAARPADAEPLIDQVVAELRVLGAAVETGCFRADMVVSIVNEGPATLIIET
jgi:D-tyrosyl-tRNA(Tyr) deacylase